MVRPAGYTAFVFKINETFPIFFSQQMTNSIKNLRDQREKQSIIVTISVVFSSKCFKDILYTNSRQETIERKQQSETALHRRGGYIHATHTREARNRERNYLDASLAYPVRLGVLLRVPAEFEDCDEDGQSQAANQHDKDTAWNGKNRKLIILPPPAVSAPSPFLLPRMLHG